MSTGLVSKENCYDDILDWATRREAFVKCRVSDIYRLRATRSLRGSNDGIFFLDQQPCRVVQVVGWVSAISFELVQRDASDSGVKVAVTIDDPDGQYNITVHRTLKTKPRLNSTQSAREPATDSSKPAYRYVPKYKPAQPVVRGNIGPSGPPRDESSGRTVTETKQPIFPCFRVGDVLRVKGKINEWRRRDGRVIRELNASEATGGEIDIIDPAQEMEHIRQVEQLRLSVFNRPFQIPVPDLLKQPNSKPTKVGNASDTGSPLKKRRLGAEPSSEAEMGGTMGMSSTAGYGDRLRHPLKLHRKHLTMSTFTRYLSSYLERMTEATWSTPLTRINKVGDLESAQVIEFAAKYFPELRWPPKEMRAAMRRRKEARERDSLPTLPLDRVRSGKDDTPKAHRVLRTNLTPKRALSSGSIAIDENSNSSGGSTIEAISGACSLDHLMHVEYLRDLADRVLRQEYRRRGERRRAETLAGSSREEEKARQKADKEEYRRERKRKLRRLFREAIRLKMMEEGSIVEVALTEEDLLEQRVERESRRLKKEASGLDSFDQGWDDSFASTLSHSVLGEKTDGTNASSITLAPRSTLGQSRIPCSQKLSLANRMFPRPAGLAAVGDGSDGSEDEHRNVKDGREKIEKADPIGYVSLQYRVVGIAILHVLHLDAWERTTRYMPARDPRCDNGPSVDEVHRRISRLHERWERVGIDVVDAGIEDLVGKGFVVKFGKGWKAAKSRLEEIL